MPEQESTNIILIVDDNKSRRWRWMAGEKEVVVLSKEYAEELRNMLNDYLEMEKKGKL